MFNKDLFLNKFNKYKEDEIYIYNAINKTEKILTKLKEKQRTLEDTFYSDEETLIQNVESFLREYIFTEKSNYITKGDIRTVTFGDLYYGRDPICKYSIMEDEIVLKVGHLFIQHNNNKFNLFLDRGGTYGTVNEPYTSIFDEESIVLKNCEIVENVLWIDRISCYKKIYKTLIPYILKNKGINNQL